MLLVERLKKIYKNYKIFFCPVVGNMEWGGGMGNLAWGSNPNRDGPDM
jgi:hypothetical protein